MKFPTKVALVHYGGNSFQSIQESISVDKDTMCSDCANFSLAAIGSDYALFI